MKKLLTILLLVCACEQPRQSSVPNTGRVIADNSEYTVVARKVERGTMYEYHYKGATYNSTARGFRVVFVPDSGAQVTQAQLRVD
jgi:hypothetical protein